MSSKISLLPVGLACAGSFVIYRFTQMILIGRRLKAYRYMLCSDKTIWRVLCPSYVDIPGVVHGNMHPMRAKHSEFDQVGMEAYVEVCFEDPTSPATFLADPEAIKEMTRPKAPFVQDIKAVKKLFGMYGSNLLTLEGDEWKRHRRITQKAFSEENAKLVWSESVFVMEKLFEKWDAQEKKEVYVSQINAITEELALMVISSAALGQRMSWGGDSDKALPPGYTLSCQQAINIVSRTVVTRVLTPRWAEGRSARTRTMATGFREFGKYLQNMATTYKRKGELDQDVTGTEALTVIPTDNLFKIIMTANEDETAKDTKAFTDEEVFGNSFFFLMAGHETTAHALAFSLGLLAVHPEVQEAVYAQVKKTLGLRRRLEYSDLNELKLVTGTLLESLRMYPVVPRVSKLVAEDSILTVARCGPGADESVREQVFLPAGSRAVIAITAVHYNPRYWPEPEEFRPARFTEGYNKDAFLAFGVGRRACIGRKFAETEGAAVLAAILARYKVSLDQSKLHTIQGESLQTRRERLLRPNYNISLAPEKLPLLFKRRD